MSFSYMYCKKCGKETQHEISIFKGYKEKECIECGNVSEIINEILVDNDRLNNHLLGIKNISIKDFLHKVESFYGYEDKYESKTIFEFLEDLKEIAKENGVEL